MSDGRRVPPRPRLNRTPKGECKCAIAKCGHCSKYHTPRCTICGCEMFV